MSTVDELTTMKEWISRILSSPLIAPHLTPAVRTEWVYYLLPNLRTIGYTTPHRVASILAQMSIESAGFTKTIEDMHYHLPALMATFGSHFASEADALPYVMQPEKLGNLVYANRYGNGDVASGDGYLYRGRGILGVTFKDNYQKIADRRHATLEDTVAFMETIEGAVVSACIWWSDPERRDRLNAAADNWNLAEMTRIINGGENGLAQRRIAASAALALI